MAVLTGFEFNEANLHHLFTDTTGGIAHEMEAAGEAIAVAAQERIGTDHPDPRATTPPHYASTQAYGPPVPFRRSGDLQASVRSTPALVFGGVMEVNVVADASHRGFPYPLWLRIQGYEFVDLSGFGH